MNIDFERSTLERIDAFQTGLVELINKYPNFDYKLAREFLKTGKKSEAMPEEVYDEILRLNELRTKAIKVEMFRAAAKAKLMGKEIPEKFLDGSSLSPFFDEKMYDLFPSFGVYEFLSWYDLTEIEKLKSQKSTDEITEYVEDIDQDER